MISIKNRILSGVMAAALVATGLPGIGEAIYASALDDENRSAIEQSEAAVGSVSASTDRLDFRGGEVKLTVSGSGLTSDNWGVNVKACYEGSDMAASTAPAYQVKDMTAEGVTIVFSRNSMRNTLDLVITVGTKSGNTVSSQAQVVVKMDGKTYKTESAYYPESAVLESLKQVLVTFDREVVLMDEDPAYTCPLFTLADSSGNRVGGKAVSVAVNEKTVRVAFDEDIPDNAYKIVIDEGAIKLGESNGVVTANGNTSWKITRSSTISEINFESKILDSKGGTVKASLEGYKVEDIDLKSLSAKIMIAGQASPSDIPVTIAKDESGKPFVSFEVPENTGDKTKSYILKLYRGGSEILTSVEARENRNVVAVLPKGTSRDERTLGTVTIAAMNSSSGDNLKDAVAEVSPQLGSLKVEIRLYGTNLDELDTMIRCVDENNYPWPVYDVPECDGTWRFIAIAGTNKNGIFGSGNAQLVELLPPRYAGTNKTYRIEVSIDGGKTWYTEDPVTLTVNNASIKGETDFRNCGAEDFKYITINHVDENGNEIAKSDTVNGYVITPSEVLNVKAKDIKCYEPESLPELPAWVGDMKDSYDIVYRSCHHEVTDPAKAPTYFATGLTAGKHCDRCGKVIVERKTVAKRVLAKAKAPSLKTGKRSITVKYQAVKDATGYQIRYQKRGAKTEKTVTFKGSKAASRKLSKLSSKKYYNVKVRAIITHGGKTAYGSWSASRSIKVK